MNNKSKIIFLFDFILARIYATGYAIIKHKIVVITARSILVKSIFIDDQLEKNQTKLSNENPPVFAVNA